MPPEIVAIRPPFSIRKMCELRRHKHQSRRPGVSSQAPNPAGRKAPRPGMHDESGSGSLKRHLRERGDFGGPQPETRIERP